MPESTTLRPCYVFGPWTIRPSGDPIAAVRDAPNPSERAEVWLYEREDDGTPVPDDVAGWYGCFGAMADSVRLGPPDMNVDRAKAALDILMFKAGHLFAEDVQEMRDLARIACAEPVALPASPDALARELYEASPLGYGGASSLGPVQTWPWDKAPDGAPYTDPRAHRPTYTPYQRHPHALKRIDWGDFPIRDLLGAFAFGI